MKIFLLIWIALGIVAYAEERTWTSDDGKELVGELIRDSGESVVLKIKDKEYTIPLTRLSEADREWLETRRKEIEEKKTAFAALAGTTKTFPTNETQKVTFHVYYPTNYSPDSPPPMIILFSASGQGKAILEKFIESCETMGWVGVGCDTFKNGVDDSIQDPLFGELLPIMEKSVFHNPDRLYLGGISGGAMRALGYTAQFDRPWKGVISCGGWLGKRFDLEYRKDMAVAWVNGDKDKNANGWIDNDSAVLEKRGCKTKAFHFPGGHEVGPPATLTEAMKWALQNTK